MKQTRILIIDGNAAETNAQTIACGGRATGDGYARTLQSLCPSLDIRIARPVEDGLECLPESSQLKDYDGIAITGSALNAYNDQPEVQVQIELARQAFESGVPVFGSCWGLQVMCVALGGEVQANPKGRELGIGRKILVNETGLAHPMLVGKCQVFDAVSIHLDEVTRLPENAIVLAGNAMSEVQAIEIRRGNHLFWGVQYHPEFDLGEITAIMQRY
ncbi:MAG: type 1 glutamine amidotransferase [Alphaproteobacteria bacterium]|jgi:GMP synthase (glutamine-hydrolysing)|nr:type 1 glutamine amidotransferase [Alphaproteobacteria bacterium]MBT4084584.1 type 1 glutamine amidotransferase [Alphaproteobacteria bacterium]MBT4546024.1 type 1 glutamine amidotransferase [Alphaproteobacteria bacterium]MBT7746273.1 type 1 glutamine amidotransferase [Alphaproteobacteria bacterium]